MSISLQQLEVSADNCFQYVCEKIRQDGVHPRSVFFGTTLDSWLRESAPKIVVACEPPSSAYVRAQLNPSAGLTPATPDAATLHCEMCGAEADTTDIHYYCQKHPPHG